MPEENERFDKRLEKEIRDHFERYVAIYDNTIDKNGLDVLEYKLSKNGNRVIDRDLLGAYLSLKALDVNNSLQRRLVVLTTISIGLSLIALAISIVH